MNFNIGDRVKVHRGGRAPFKGKIEAITGDTSIQVIEDGFYSMHEDAPFHPRQLTKLKPKAKVVKREARRVWLHKELEPQSPRTYSEWMIWGQVTMNSAKRQACEVRNETV